MEQFWHKQLAEKVKKAEELKRVRDQEDEAAEKDGVFEPEAEELDEEVEQGGSESEGFKVSTEFVILFLQF